MMLHHVRSNAYFFLQLLTYLVVIVLANLICVCLFVFCCVCVCVCPQVLSLLTNANKYYVMALAEVKFIYIDSDCIVIVVVW